MNFSVLIGSWWWEVSQGNVLAGAVQLLPLNWLSASVYPAERLKHDSQAIIFLRITQKYWGDAPVDVVPVSQCSAWIVTLSPDWCPRLCASSHRSSFRLPTARRVISSQRQELYLSGLCPVFPAELKTPKSNRNLLFIALLPAEVLLCTSLYCNLSLSELQVWLDFFKVERKDFLSWLQ